MAPIKKTAMTKDQFDAIFTKLKNVAKLSPEKIAAELGVSRVTLYRWASGARNIDHFTAQAIRLYASTKLK